MIQMARSYVFTKAAITEKDNIILHQTNDAFKCLEMYPKRMSLLKDQAEIEGNIFGRTEISVSVLPTLPNIKQNNHCSNHVMTFYMFSYVPVERRVNIVSI